jgi:hypothetical protein
VSRFPVRFVFWAYLFFLIAVAATVTNPADPDLWHRLAVGEYLWQKGHFPDGDTFSYLSDYQEIADHEWGSAVIFYQLWQWGGGLAMVLTKIVTLTATLVLIVRAGIQNRPPTILLAAFYVLVMMALLPSFQSTVRCMIFTHLFFALWLYWFQRERQGRVIPTILYVLSMIVWANLHGGFAIGLGWLVLVGVVEAVHGAPWKIWAARFGLCWLATLVNPFGWQLWWSTGRALVANRGGFAEWAPVSWSEPLVYPGYKLLLIGVLISLAVLIRRQGRSQTARPEVLLIGAFMMLALDSARHTSLFALVAGALMPGLFPQARPFRRVEDPVRRLSAMAFNTAMIVVPLLTALRVLQTASLALEYPPSSCPVEAVAFLQRENVRGNLLVPFNYGSYALWELRGRMRVSMDGRYDLVYKRETYRRVDDFFSARGDWKGLLTSPAPEAVLLPRDAPVYARLRAEPGWTEVWSNESDAVFRPKLP